MKNILPLLLAMVTVFPVQRSTAQVANWKQIPIPQLPAFKPKQPKRVELSNGMVIFLQEDHELPLIDASARIRGGSVNEPADKAGLVDIYGEVWRTGGTKSQTGDQLDDFLEVRAAKVETGGGPDSTTISFSCLRAIWTTYSKLSWMCCRIPSSAPTRSTLPARRCRPRSPAATTRSATSRIAKR